MDETDVSRPAETTQADVTLITRGVTVTARVDRSDDVGIVVSPLGEGTAWKTAVKPGDKVEVFWVAAHEERTLPARITDVEHGDEPSWRLAPTGPSERSQRRKAVRGRVQLPVVMPWADSQLTGETVDLSEAGMRALVDGWGVPPESGTRMSVTLDLGTQFVDVHGTLVWCNPRGAQWLLAVSFEDVDERDGDRLRQRVFEALRAERALAR